MLLTYFENIFSNFCMRVYREILDSKGIEFLSQTLIF